MKKGVISKLLIVITIVSITVEFGILIGYYMLANADFNKYNTEYEVTIAK